MTGPHHHDAPPSAIEQRVATLEALLTDKGLVKAEFLDAIVRSYENDIGPRNGARVVARAWTDPEYQQRLLAEGTPAITELGFGGPEGQHVVVVENRPSVHNVIVCTLCSCYPWALLGLPPVWYKSPPYRARMVREPRAVLREMGSSWQTTSRSASGTPAPRSATWSCPSARPAPRISTKSS